MKNTVLTLAKMKEKGEKISQLTCYDYSTARIMDESGVNMILVGDSLGMTMQGYKDTLPVTVDEMIIYGRSVQRACSNAFVTIDMPFMSYQISPEQALLNAGRIMKEAGAFAVTLECVPPKLAELITRKLDIITIGIGAGNGCDAQVLVWQDMLGITPAIPKFVKQFSDIGEQMKKAFVEFDKEVKSGDFPTDVNMFIKSDCSDEFLTQLDKEY